jgi:hypothetical protein
VVSTQSTTRYPEVVFFFFFFFLSRNRNSRRRQPAMAADRQQRYILINGSARLHAIHTHLKPEGDKLS